MAITGATGDDLSGIEQLLRRSGLPTDGVADHINSMIVWRDRDRIVGCAGLESYGRCALLRSVAVDESARGTGVGRRLVESILERARAQGMTDVFLLTTTAEEFFPRFGFGRIDRADVPVAVQRSVEFTSACPTSAVVMTTRLTP